MRTRYICPPDFELLCGSQDPGGISNIRISKDPLSDDVLLVYDQSGEKDVMTITFKMGKVNDAWKIQDAIYKTRTCNGFPGPPNTVSLRKQVFLKC